MASRARRNIPRVGRGPSCDRIWRRNEKVCGIGGLSYGQQPHVAYETNYSSSNETSFRLGATQKGQETKVLVIAASVAGLDEAQQTYDHLASIVS